MEGWSCPNCDRAHPDSVKTCPVDNRTYGERLREANNPLRGIAGLRRLTAEERESLKKYEREMEEVTIPQIIKDVKANQRRAAEARTRVL